MSRRASQPDTDADIELRACISPTARKSFVMVAGAGSGKTTSLVKALSTIAKEHGAALKRRRQRVACITYTEIAAREIWADVGTDPMFQVSTIHSFFWSLVRSFQNDVREWVGRRIQERINDLEEKAANFGARVQQRTRDKNARDILRYREELASLAAVRSFSYGTGSNYSSGILGHDDILRIVPQLLLERPLFRTLLAQQFPFVFVDESQDTAEAVVEALKAVQQQMGDRFCLGFFGDPMQKIYATGVGPIEPGAGWASIKKEENFRCPSTVLAVANAIRNEGDKLVQTRGRTVKVGEIDQPVVGSARIFVLPANDQRDALVRRVRKWLAANSGDETWMDGAQSDVKVLVIVHRMAANRLGFGDLYSALNDKAPDKFKDGFLDATAWPLRPFMTFILPVTEALNRGEEFEAIRVLREHSPNLAKGVAAGAEVAKLLKDLSAASLKLVEIMKPVNEATVRDALVHVRDSQLATLDPRLIAYLDEAVPQGNAEGAEEDEAEEIGREIGAMDAFLRCPAYQLSSFRNYIEDKSPFSTQQGIKGAEFEKVLVILDDDEGTHVQFSYDKLFKLKALSKTDEANISEGRETSIERTRRLFYVCCTRALSDLAVIYFAPDAKAAAASVRLSGLFPADAILLEADI